MTETNSENKKQQNLLKNIGVFVRKYIIILIFALILLIALIVWALQNLFKQDSDWLPLSGRLEGYETDIGPKYGGKIDYIVAREGAAVDKGELLVKIEDSELKAQLKAANSNIAIAKQQAIQAKQQLDIVKNQIRQARLNYQQSKGESAGTIQQARASVSSAETQFEQAKQLLNQANAEYELARINFKRYTNLLKNGAIPRNIYDQARTSFDVAIATRQSREEGLDVARSQINQAKGLLEQALTTELNPDIRSEQIELLNSQLKQAKSQLEAAKSNVAMFQAQKDVILAQIAYLNISSPISGVIIARSAEPGEIVSSGRTILTLLNLNTVYLRGYIPEGSIGLVRVGQKANVYLDSAPKKPLKAQVSEIDSQASFTPENIYFRNERVKQVFGVKLCIYNPAGFAKPGMPADAEIYIGKPEENKDNYRPAKYCQE